MIQTKTIGRILASSSPQAQAKLVGSKKYNAIRGIAVIPYMPVTYHPCLP